MKPSPFRFKLLPAIGLAVIFVVNACAFLPAFGGKPPAKPTVVQQVLSTAAPVLQATPTLTPAPIFTAPPTYTPFPTYTTVPTFTPLPTFTLPPTATPNALTATLSTQAPSLVHHDYVLRVWNSWGKTLWIGTKIPYGGLYIEPKHYEEFYPPKPMAIRVWYCTGWVDLYKQLSGCYSRNFHVNKPFVEVSVP